MVYSVKRIEALAAVARISLRPGEAERLCRELDTMYARAEVLQDTAAGENPFLETVLLSELREDRAQPPLPRETVLRMAPATRDRYLTVPRAVEE
ncbi:MAG: aspartyl/glutamyl-tRNA amidotransferase subunit C [Clostridia bacterium]|nr:aspartyl/glutamyl-tRNA amidotransferase subunit C [Clostridia bacterium]